MLTKEEATSMLDMLASVSDESIRKHVAEVLSAKKDCWSFASVLLKPVSAQKPGEVPAESVINAAVQVPNREIRINLATMLKCGEGPADEKAVITLVVNAVALIPEKFKGVQLVNAFAEPVGAKMLTELDRRFNVMDDGNSDSPARSPKRRVGEVLSYILSEICRKTPEGSDKDRLEERIRAIKCELQNILSRDTLRASERPTLASKWAAEFPECTSGEQKTPEQKRGFRRAK